jgi:hypothetical protein
MRHSSWWAGQVSACAVLSVARAEAQVVGTFSWQTAPYCNVVTMTVVQQGGLYQLAGSDNLCGAGTAVVTGSAIPTATGAALGFGAALSNAPVGVCCPGDAVRHVVGRRR